MTSPRHARRRKCLELTLSDAARENLAEVADKLGVTRSAVADAVFEALAVRRGTLVVCDVGMSRTVPVGLPESTVEVAKKKAGSSGRGE